MRFKTVTEHFTEPHTRDGITVQVNKQRQILQPQLPKDWDQRAVRASVTVVLALTLISITWSTWSIGSLLHGGIGYLAGVIYDAAWAVCLLLEFMARFDASRRAFPRRLGWGLLLCTMAAIYWNGALHHSAALGVVGAGVSAFAKLLWLGVMRHIHRELSPEDQQWVAAQMSAANAKLAIASVRREVQRTEGLAVAQLLAMEAETGTAGLLLAKREQPEVSAPVTDDPSPTVRSAVRAAVATMPDASPDDIVEQLARVGVDVSEAVVRDLSGLSGHSPAKENEGADPRLTDTIRGLVRIGVREREAVLVGVKSIHGEDVDPESVTRILRRVTSA